MSHNIPNAIDRHRLRYALNLSRDTSQDSRHHDYFKTSKDRWARQLYPSLWHQHRLEWAKAKTQQIQRANLRNVANILWLKQLLGEQQRFSVIKGIALVWGIYKDISYRAMSDIDFVVPLANLPTVLNTCEHADLHPTTGIKNPSLFSKARHSLSLTQTNKRINADLHGYCLRDCYQSDYDTFSDQFITESFMEHDLTIPSPEYQCLIACIHGIAERSGKPKKFTWLLDVHMILTQTPQFSWQTLLELTQRCDKCRLMSHALHVLHITGITIPKDALRQFKAAHTKETFQSKWRHQIVLHPSSTTSRVLKLVFGISHHTPYQFWHWPLFCLYSLQLNQRNKKKGPLKKSDPKSFK